jgi:hypothetical protein
MSLSDLATTDRTHFRDRLASLGLDEKAIIAASFEVPEGETRRLEMAAHGDQRPYILETSDLDVLRRWIGVPDAAAAKLVRQPHERVSIEDDAAASERMPAPKAQASARTRGKTGAAERGGGCLDRVASRDLHKAVQKYRATPDQKKGQTRLSSDQLQVLRAAARTYIRGDFKSVAPYKPAIEAFFERFQVAAWCFTKIVVKRNATLVFGSGSHNVTAHEVIIEPGGRIVSYGHLNVNATILRRPPPIVVHLPDYAYTGPLIATRR